ncbi:MAG: HAD family hydrolase [Ruminococcaceae bacterium]|nr:HAD family hydrolase [Oscillospiraceae bacterium]
MIKGVAFDFDCTLYNRTRVWDRLTEGFITRFGKYINPSLSKADVLEILRQGDAEGIANDEKWQGIFERYIKKGLFSKELSFEKFYEFIKAEFPPAIVLHDDAMDCIEALRNRGIKTGIYTNGVSEFARLKICATGVDGCMDYILCSGDIDIEKPDARGFAALAAGMSLSIEEIAFVGDHPKNDVLGASNAGMMGIWLKDLVPWPSGFELPKYIVNNLSEILTVVEEINV